MARKTEQKWIDTKLKWFEQNPPDEKGQWVCYLQIAWNCPKILDRRTLTLEHVRSKARAPELKYEVSNLKPSCSNCNALKESLEVDEVLKKYKS